MTYQDLAAEQAKDLDYKIDTAIEALRAAFAACRHRPALAFSGGKDSTVLWHLIRTHFPEWTDRLVIIYGNTGVEYPECLKFARQLGEEWGNGNFYEAKPGHTEAEGLKYKAQQEVLQYLIQKISSEQASEIIDKRVPLGLFCLEGTLADGTPVWVGIDNTTGDAWTEDFKSKAACTRWLNGN